MARFKSESCVTLKEKEYLSLLQDSMILKALKIAGIENMPIYRSIDSIIRDDRIELSSYPRKQ